MKMTKKVLSLLLAMLLLLTAVPMTAFATEYSDIIVDAGWLLNLPPAGLVYEVDDDSVVVTDYTGDASVLCIPATIEDKDVVEIAAGAFADCNTIKAILIPDSISTIGEGAFAGCTALASVFYSGSDDAMSVMTVGANNTYFVVAERLYAASSEKAVPVTGDNTDGIQLKVAYAENDIAYQWQIKEGDTWNDIAGQTAATLDLGIDDIVEDALYRCVVSLVNSEAWYSSAYAVEIHHHDWQLDGYVYGDETHWHGCSGCKEKQDEAAHDENAQDVTPATLTAAGTIVKKCSVCGREMSSTSIPAVTSFELSTTSYTYDGSTKTPSVTVKDSAGKTLEKDTDYTVSYPSSRKNAGSYNVTVKMKGNYSGTKTLTFKINPAAVSSKFSFKLSATSYTYNGSTKTPSVTVKDSAGKTLKKDTDYTVSYPSSRKNAGSYKVTVKMKGNYSGTKTLTFKINPAAVSSKFSFKLSTSTYTYDGKTKSPSVTVKNASGTTLKKNTDYTVTYASGRKNVGKYKVTIKMKGNYSGSKTLYLTINPPKTTVSKLSPAKKAMKVYVTKKSSQVTGYQIQYSTSKSFKSYKSKTLSSYKTTSVTLKSLKAKTTYYVRVRTYKTVSGVKYYSGWSSYKYKKTK